MMDLLFFAKTLFLTIALVLVMQIEVGKGSLESHTMAFVKSSAVTGSLNGVAQGGAKLVRDLSRYVTGKVNGEKLDKTTAKQEEKKSSSSFRWLF
jgi:hypothetical protein